MSIAEVRTVLEAQKLLEKLDVLASKLESIDNRLLGVDSKLADISDKISNSNVKLDTITSRIEEEYMKTRYGRVLTLIGWFYGDKITAPGAESTLFSYTVSAEKQAYIYGFFIFATEGNTFEIRWRHTPLGATSPVTYDYPIYFGGPGTLHFADLIPINEGIPADPSSVIEVVNINAGSTGSTYKVGLLIGET